MPYCSWCFLCRQRCFLSRADSFAFCGSLYGIRKLPHFQVIWKTIEMAPFSVMRTGIGSPSLFVKDWHARCPALRESLPHPYKIEWPRLRARLTAHNCPVEARPVIINTSLTVSILEVTVTGTIALTGYTARKPLFKVYGCKGWLVAHEAHRRWCP